jgi:hypothetical protein
MNLLWLLLALQAGPPAHSPKNLWQQALASVERSGRAVEIVETTKEKLQPLRIAPGAPPLLAFRYLEGQRRHRFGELGLVIDDAGH